MPLLLTLAALTVLPLTEPVRDCCDRVEVNHFYDECGRRVFDQVIFYDWSPGERRYQVVAWRLLKCDGLWPRRDWTRGDYAALWHDGEIFREVRAATRVETWTQTDPELSDRDYLPKEMRRELSKTLNDH